MKRHLVVICLLLFLLSNCETQSLPSNSNVREYVPSAKKTIPEASFTPSSSKSNISNENKNNITDTSEENFFHEKSATYSTVQENIVEVADKQMIFGNVSGPNQDINNNLVEKEEPSDEMIVKVCDYIPSIKTELRYATDNNFTGKKVYSFKEAYLRYGTVKKLKEANAQLNKIGYCLLIWDAYRPVEAQKILWNCYPDPAYVSDPDSGNTSHERGNTVDISILGIDGNYVEMPTDFDDFSSLADRDYSDCTETAATNALMLEKIMLNSGFRGYFGEWWHYTDLDDYPTEYIFVPQE